MMRVKRFGMCGIAVLLSMGGSLRASGSDALLADAAEKMDRATIRTLVQRRVDVNAPQPDGMTALHWAAYQDDREIAELLVRAGADVNVANRYGVTLLSHGAAVHAKDDRRGQTALMWAAAEGHADVVQALIDAGADVRLRLASGFTPLLFAVREGRLGVVRVLLKAGADVNETVPVEGRRRGYGGRPLPAGTSALLVAVTNAHFELAASLLDAGANPN